MEYFNLLHFKKEPFSNSPEPEFLFAAEQYSACLQMLELAVRLKRGLNIVIGDVGTGKTTLCRKLIQNLSAPSSSDSPVIETFLLLDPAVENKLAFLKTVAGILGIDDIPAEDQEWHFKEKIKNFLFEKGVDEQKITVLIVDEGQKIPDECLEILREFLNYETNSFKLLQIIIFAQPELQKSLAAKANLLDRVNYLYHLKPLSFKQMKAMIAYRISVARQEPVLQHPIFSFSGLLAIYFGTGGYPRKVVSLCHQVLLMMIIRGKNRAGWFLVRACINRMHGKLYRRVSWVLTGLLIVVLLFFSASLYINKEIKIDPPQPQRVQSGIEVKKESLNPSGDAEQNSSELQKKDAAYLDGIHIKKRITVWRILDNVYGDTDKELTQKFVLANPHIKDLQNTANGDVIQVPMLPERAQRLGQDTIIVALENSRNLEDIYFSFVEKKDKGNLPELLFLSFWNKRQGRQFVIALNKRFASAEEAREAIRKLPQKFAVSAQVLSQWDSDTIVFNRKFFSR